MATILLQAAGQAIGTALGGPIGGAIGSALGAFGGAQIDSALLASNTTTARTGSRLSDVTLQASTEGAAVARAYGRVRVSGQVIWATKFKETIVTSSRSSGGKGGPKTTVVSTDYLYSMSFAV